MSEPQPTGRGFGRVLVFVYGIFALSATGRSSYQLIAKASEAPLAYSLSAFAALVYIVATWALATGKRSLATATVLVELVGVIVIGATIDPANPDKATVWSGFGSGYGYVPLVLPMIGLWWLRKTR